MCGPSHSAYRDGGHIECLVHRDPIILIPDRHEGEAREQRQAMEARQRSERRRYALLLFVGEYAMECTR